MKNKTNINTVYSGDTFYQALVGGLNKRQKQYVDSQIKEYGIENLHIGILRKIALTK